MNKRKGEKGRKEGVYMRTVYLLRDFASFGECEEDLLRRRLWDGALEVGGDVNSTIWTVNLTGTPRMKL